MWNREQKWRISASEVRIWYMVCTPKFRVAHAFHFVLICFLFFGFFGGLDTESLLLGSLLWFLGIVCLFTRPVSLQSRLAALLLESAGEKDLRSRAPGGISGHAFEALTAQSFIMTRRCRASRTKMKSCRIVPRALAWGDLSLHGMRHFWWLSSRNQPTRSCPGSCLVLFFCWV